MSCDTANTGEIDILHDHIPVAVAKTYKVNRLSASILSYLKERTLEITSLTIFLTSRTKPVAEA